MLFEINGDRTFLLLDSLEKHGGHTGKTRFDLLITITFTDF